jgi:5-methylcytosine-specific restriction endonuclease McrA
MAIYHRDGFACVYCGITADASRAKLTLDHVVACEVGGTNEATNLVTACLSCNSAKQARTMRGWLSYLRAAGRDTAGVARRVRRQTAKPLDREAGRAIVAARRA